MPASDMDDNRSNPVEDQRTEVPTGSTGEQPATELGDHARASGSELATPAATPDPSAIAPSNKKKKHRGNPQNLVPFKAGKGDARDPRIWTGGRPNTFESFREALQEYLNTPTSKNKTRLTTIIDKMANTRGERKTLLEYAFGRVPETVSTDDAGKAMSWGEFIQQARAQRSPKPAEKAGDVVEGEVSEQHQLDDTQGTSHE